VVEEALSIGLTPERRAGMAAAARAAAQAAGYVNAGTVEFIADAAGFYFIEMNTRLQVEHPVTEMITGLDLVEWQLRVAFGEKLPLRQDAIKANGHAIEARIYAEDADKGFLPSIGRIARWREPPSRDGIRIDTGFRAGDTVTPHFDALLAKLIAWGADRSQALDRLTEAVGELDIGGVITNLDFLKALLRDPQVRSGEIDTGFIERELAALTAAARALPAPDLAAASAAVLLRERDERAPDADAVSPWSRTDGWMAAGRRARRLSFRRGTARHDAVVWYQRDGLAMEFGGASAPLRFAAHGGGQFDVALGDAKETVPATWTGRDLALRTPRGRLFLHWIDPFLPQAGPADAVSRIVAPMPGTVVRILAEAGSDVPRGAPLIVIEAMKMEHTLRAPADGHLKALKCAVGEVVQEGAELADFEPVAGE
jgi:3-methylcrotonyl-CoA carboxylase alpha subunit